MRTFGIWIRSNCGNTGKNDSGLHQHISISFMCIFPTRRTSNDEPIHSKNVLKIYMTINKLINFFFATILICGYFFQHSGCQDFAIGCLWISCAWHFLMFVMYKHHHHVYLEFEESVQSFHVIGNSIIPLILVVTLIIGNNPITAICVGLNELLYYLCLKEANDDLLKSQKPDIETLTPNNHENH